MADFSGPGTARSAGVAITSCKALTIRPINLAVSDSSTGVEATHTSPTQWLKTIVDDVGCQVTRK